MKKYQYIDHYDFKSILPLKRIKAEVSRVENRWIFKKYAAFYLAIIFLISTIGVSIYVGMYYRVGLQNFWVFPAVLIPLCMTVLLFFYYFKITKKMITEIRKIPIIQRLIDKGSPFFYNHMLKNFPELAGVIITSATETKTRNLNLGFLSSARTFTVDARETKGGQIKFSYNNINFIFTNECVGERRVPRINRNGNIMGHDDYYTFVNTLLNADLRNDNRGVYLFSRQKISNLPASFKLFESESIEFNNKLSIYFDGDDLSAFEKFNPLVIDKFNQTNLRAFHKAYANATGFLVFEKNEVIDVEEETLNTIFGIQLTGRRFLDDLDQNFKRFEKNLAILERKLNFVKPFYN